MSGEVIHKHLLTRSDTSHTTKIFEVRLTRHRNSSGYTVLTIWIELATIGHSYIDNTLAFRLADIVGVTKTGRSARTTAIVFHTGFHLSKNISTRYLVNENSVLFCVRASIEQIFVSNLTSTNPTARTTRTDKAYIGSISNIMYSKGLVFAPSEVDMSIRDGWFYHADEQPHSLERLFNTYLNSVGSNTTFILNIPPMPNGKFDERDVERLHELGEKLKNEFGTNIAENAEITVTPYCGSDTQTVVEITLDGEHDIHYIDFCENIAEGQRIESFIVQTPDSDGIWRNRAFGTTVGARKIVPLKDLRADRIRIFVNASRDTPEFGTFKIY